MEWYELTQCQGRYNGLGYNIIRTKGYINVQRITFYVIGLFTTMYTMKGSKWKIIQRNILKSTCRIT